MKFDNQLRYAVRIISQYDGEIPLHQWLKGFFRKNPQMGSADRRQVSGMVYHYFRLGHALKKMEPAERILLAVFLCSTVSSDLLSYFRPSWNLEVSGNLDSKCLLCRQTGIDFRPEDIFPWKERLSAGIDHEAFCRSFLQQPDLFIRIRPGREKEVIRRLEDAKISFQLLSPSAVRLPNGTPIDRLFQADKEIVVQDYTSQRTGEYFYPGPGTDPAHARAWDCCAGSGGKSILLHDRFPGINLTVSDLRPSIMANLKKRFNHAGIGNYRMLVADLSGESRELASLAGGFDLILVDAPCTGSGTWARNPEELFYFREDKIQAYAALQRKIIGRVLKKCRKGGRLVYVTCSAFRDENEDNREYITREFGLIPETSAILTGYAARADSMYIASFIT